MNLGWPECDLCKRDAVHVRSSYEGKLFKYQFVCDSHISQYPDEGDDQLESYGRWMRVLTQRERYLKSGGYSTRKARNRRTR